VGDSGWTSIGLDDYEIEPALANPLPNIHDFN
jgi:hypothetical protein